MPSPFSRRRFIVQGFRGAAGAMLAGRLLTAAPGLSAASPAAFTAGTAPPAEGWFADSLFNLLVDYYPEVHFRPYGSGATTENVLKVLRELKPGYIIIYAKGHSGTTTFPSSLKTEHPKLAQDMPALFRRLTRETGTRLILYYSGLLDGLAGQRHPEWIMKNADGSPRAHFGNFKDLFTAYGICPRSGYWDQWVKVHLDEMIGRYQPDGIWVDGDWGGPCHCERCRRDRWEDVAYEWRSKFRKHVKSLKPDCLYSAGNVGPRREKSDIYDWRSGDFFSPTNHRLQISAAMRRYTTLGVPYDAFTCDTMMIHARPDIRNRTKTLPRMLQEGATVLANGGQWGYWTYPMPNGALVPSRMRQAVKAAEFARARRHVFLHTQSVPWVAVLDAEPRDHLRGSTNAPLGAVKALVELHRPPDVIDETELPNDARYDLIVVPEQPVLTPATVAKLEGFVRRGGKLLSTGVSIRAAEMQRLQGVKLAQAGAAADGHVLLRSGDPARVAAAWDKVEPLDAKELYPLYRSWDDRNPELWRFGKTAWPMNGLMDEEKPEKAGFPAATLRRLGQGVAAHVPAPCFDLYWTYGYPDLRAWFRELLETIQPDPMFRTDAPGFVEVSLRRRKDSLLVHFVNGNPGRDLSWYNASDLWADEVPAVGPITCQIRCSARPQAVTIEPGGMPAQTEWKDGALKAVLPRLEIHACLVLRGGELARST